MAAKNTEFSKLYSKSCQRILDVIQAKLALKSPIVDEIYTHLKRKKTRLPDLPQPLMAVYISPTAQVLSHHGAQSWACLPSSFTLLTLASPRSLDTNVASSEQGYRFDPWSRKISHAEDQLSPCATTTEPVL